ncbi:flavin monoamine oxidase family protein [Sulfitobacter aestuariivivens]|uniref:flavin monoamine oxidase family protein n=1 Tax=Sulfitobacter aestuariivivens TaxID=2766981 RepID=UPI0036103D9F
MRIKDKNLTPEEIEDFGAYQDRMWQAINDAGAVEPDTTTRACLPDGRWSETAVHYIPQMLAGNADTTSARDVRNYDHHDGDWLVGGGLGAFIKDLHGDVPVRTNCPVHKIDTTGSGVRVTTPDGVLEAAHLILTVSTGVLASGSIQFIPALPARKRDAIGMLPMGGMNKIAIEFDRDWTEMTEGQMADYHKGGDAYCSVLFGLYGSSLSVGFVAGRCADALEANGPGATTDLCLEALQAHFGSTITQNIRATQETAWRLDPFIQGAYSYAKPGGSDARRVLAEPIADRLFFAGEATMTHTYATVHGAWLSGRRSAEQVLALHAPAPSRQAG